MKRVNQHLLRREAEYIRKTLADVNKQIESGETESPDYPGITGRLMGALQNVQISLNIIVSDEEAK